MFDKVIDSTVLENRLTQIADELRIKNGTTEPLQFPQGFVDAIKAIETGGGDYEVVEGEITPTVDTKELQIEGTQGMIGNSHSYFLLYPWNITRIYSYNFISMIVGDYRGTSYEGAEEITVYLPIGGGVEITYGGGKLPKNNVEKVTLTSPSDSNGFYAGTKLYWVYARKVV